MKGFKLLESKCEGLTHEVAELTRRLADSDEKLKSREQACIALEEAAQLSQTSHVERVLKLEDQVREFETTNKELVSEKLRIKSASLELSERLRDNRLVLEQCRNTLKDRESVRLML